MSKANCYDGWPAIAPTAPAAADATEETDHGGQSGTGDVAAVSDQLASARAEVEQLRARVEVLQTMSRTEHEEVNRLRWMLEKTRSANVLAAGAWEADVDALNGVEAERDAARSEVEQLRAKLEEQERDHMQGVQAWEWRIRQADSRVTDARRQGWEDGAKAPRVAAFDGARMSICKYCSWWKPDSAGKLCVKCGSVFGGNVGTRADEAKPAEEASGGGTHELKCWPEFFDPMYDGRKPFEWRRDDRGYQVGDVLWIREWDPSDKRYTGREIRVEVTYVFGREPASRLGVKSIPHGYVVMGVRRLPLDASATTATVAGGRLELAPGWAVCNGEDGEEECSWQECSDYARVVNSDKGKRYCLAHAAEGMAGSVTPPKEEKPGLWTWRIGRLSWEHGVYRDDVLMGKMSSTEVAEAVCRAMNGASVAGGEAVKDALWDEAVTISQRLGRLTGILPAESVLQADAIKAAVAEERERCLALVNAWVNGAAEAHDVFAQIASGAPAPGVSK